MNAAGWCKNLATFEKLARTPVSEITVGSTTRDPRPGNEGTVFWKPDDDAYALNSLGLPNPGIEEVLSTLPQMRAVANAYQKKLRVSIAGFSPQEYGYVAHRAARVANVIEINLGCPNAWGPEGQKPIAAFDLDLVAEILDHVEDAVDASLADPRIAIKVSPYSDPLLLAKMAQFVNAHGFVDEVVAINTFPNAYAWNDAQPAITPGGGLAGMSGKALKAIALGHVIQFKQKLNRTIDVTAVGGISSGEDIIDYALAGVTQMQVGTHYFLHGEKVFSELLQETAAFVQ